MLISTESLEEFLYIYVTVVYYTSAMAFGRFFLDQRCKDKRWTEGATCLFCTLTPGKVSSGVRLGKLTCAAGTMVQRMDASAIEASQKKALRKSFNDTYG